MEVELFFLLCRRCFYLTALRLGLLFEDIKQFNFKDQKGTRLDDRRHALVAMGEIRRQIEFKG